MSLLIESFIGGSGSPPIDIPIQMQRICWIFFCYSYPASIRFENFVGIISIFNRILFVSFLISEAKHLRQK